jgi:archaemetzincin
VKTGALSLLLLVLAAPSAETLWPDLPRPKPGEWRWRHKEKHQDEEAYRASNPCRVTKERRVAYVLPAWTRPSPELAAQDDAEALIGAFFALPVRRLEPRALPKSAYDEERRRYSIRALLPFLKRTLPDDAAFLLVVTDRGLRLPGSRFVDGWGSLRDRVGICSTRRLQKDRKEARRRRRWLGLVLHEATHMLSVPHCTERRCLMNGALDWEEADERPLLLCWECRGKVCGNVGAKVDARYRALLEAWRDAGVREAVEMIERVRELG